MANRQRSSQEVLDQFQCLFRRFHHWRMPNVFHHGNFCPWDSFEKLCIVRRYNGIESAEDREYCWSRLDRRKSFIRRFGGAINDALIVGCSESAIGQLPEISYEFFGDDEIWCESLRKASPNCRVALEMREQFADDWREIDFGHYRKGRIRSGRAIDQDHAINAFRRDLGESNCDLAAHGMANNYGV